MTSPRLTRQVSRRIRAVLACGILLGTGAIGTSALWSTTAATSSSQFTTADVKIRANEQEHLTFTFPETLLPGDSTAYVVKVQNKGGMPFTYTATVASSSSLGKAMTFTYVAGVTPSGGHCPGSSGGVPITDNASQFRATTAALAPSTGVDSLCLQLTLPTTAAAGLAGTSGTVTFAFTATGV